MAFISETLINGLLAFLVLLLCYQLYRLIRWFVVIQNIPGAEGYHILHGNLHHVPADGELRIAYYRKFMESVPGCRKLMRFWYGPAMPIVHVYHPDLIKPMFKASVTRKPTNLGGALRLLKPWVGDGLVTTTTLETWSRNRKMITPAFHFNILRSYCTIFNEAADVLLDKISTQTQTSHAIDIITPVSLCVLESILRCALSYQGDVQQSSQRYPTAVSELHEMWTVRSRTIWMWPDFMLHLFPTGRRFLAQCKYMHEIADNVIRERRGIREREGDSSKRKRDFVDTLMDASDESGVHMTDKEIRDEVNTFLVAGHHTTSTAIPWLLYLLAQNPEYQRQVQREIDEIMGGREVDHVNWNDIGQLSLLTLCAKESLRLYPPAPNLQRELIKDIKLDGHTIPKGTILVAMLNNLHRHPDVWERPDDFYPERFQLEEGRKAQDSYANIPFAAGPRNCLGQNFAMTELKVVVSRLLYKFNFEIDPDAPPITRAGLLLLRSVNGIKLKVTKRELRHETIAMA